MSAMYQIGIRLMRGILVAALAGGIGWIAVQLPVGMVLARNFTSAEQMTLERIWLVGCVLSGFLIGVCYRSNWLTGRFRWICWGAVISLAGLVVLSNCLQSLLPSRPMQPSPVQILGRGVRVDDIAFTSAPGALLAGGFLGWYFHRYRTRQKHGELASDQRDP